MKVQLQGARRGQRQDVPVRLLAEPQLEVERELGTLDRLLQVATVDCKYTTNALDVRKNFASKERALVKLRSKRSPHTVSCDRTTSKYLQSAQLLARTSPSLAVCARTE